LDYIDSFFPPAKIYPASTKPSNTPRRDFILKEISHRDHRENDFVGWGCAPPFLFTESFRANVLDVFEIVDTAVKSFFCICNDREKIITALKFGAYVIRHGSYINDTIMVGQAPPYATAKNPCSTNIRFRHDFIPKNSATENTKGTEKESIKIYHE